MQTLRKLALTVALITGFGLAPNTEAHAANYLMDVTSYWHHNDANAWCYTRVQFQSNGVNVCNPSQQLWGTQGYLIMHYPGQSAYCYKRYFHYAFTSPNSTYYAHWITPLLYIC